MGRSRLAKPRKRGKKGIELTLSSISVTPFLSPASYPVQGRLSLHLIRPGLNLSMAEAQGPSPIRLPLASPPLDFLRSTSHTKLLLRLHQRLDQHRLSQVHLHHLSRHPSHLNPRFSLRLLPLPSVAMRSSAFTNLTNDEPSHGTVSRRSVTSVASQSLAPR